MDSGFAATLARCALLWHQQLDEAATLTAITTDTPTLLRGVDVVAVVTVSASGTLHIKSAQGPIEKLTAALPRTLTPNQRAGGPLSPTAANRWPVSATLDHDAEMGSMICAPLGSQEMMFGTLLILGGATDSFTARSATDATTLAIHASIALAAHRQRGHWQKAVEFRDVIGQAKGILMHQRKLTAAQAFSQLVLLSQHTNLKVRDVADNLCRTGELPD